VACCARSNSSAKVLGSETSGCFSDKHSEMKIGHSKASELKKRTISCRACYGDSNQPPLSTRTHRPTPAAARRLEL
jgi:hypothetical protein